MPRRTVQKCGRRGAAGDRLDLTDELCLVWGHAFGVHDWERPLASQADFSRLWSRWGDEITRRWIEAYPGSRPAGCYLAGQIQPPTWKHELQPLRWPVKLGREVVIEDRTWQGHEVELDHLVELGIVDDEEYQAAVERLDGPDPTTGRRYRHVSSD
jgi:hypothetical protein